jgi:hypothetical protein
MKKLATATLVALAVIAATVPAFASSHGAMPAHLSLWDQMVWEVVHYAIHMQLTFEAIRVWFVSPQLGWALLDSQTLCAEQGRMTEHFFDTGMHAIETFLSTLGVLVWMGAVVAARALNSLFNRIGHRSLPTAAA